MLDHGRGECNSGTIKNESNQPARPLSGMEKRSMYRPVERDGLFLQASGDELTEVDHILAEPRIEEDFVDGVLNFKSEDTWTYLANEGFLCPSDYHQLKAGSEAQVSSIIQEGREDPKADFLDEMLQGADDVHCHNAIEDYLLDSEFSEKVLDYAPCEGHHLGHLNSDNYSQGLNRRGRVAVEMPKLVSSTTSIQEFSSYPNALDRMTIHELQEKFRSTFGRETSVKDKQWLKRRILFGLQNITQLDSVSCFLQSDVSSSENEGNLIFTCSEDSSGREYRSSTDELVIKTKRACQVVEKGRSARSYVSTASSFRSRNGGHGLLSPGDREGLSLAQKRSRKPTRRYIEESSDLKSRSCSGKLEIPVTNSRGSFRRARSQSRQRRKSLGATPLVYGQDEPRGSSIQVPFALQVWKSPSRKNASIVEHDSKDTKNDLTPSPQESQDDMSVDVTKSRSNNCVTRRKHHKIWSLSEVQKLVDGVSQYGVGRWTQIKKVLFSASAHRTSVDLKDKWRNLLRASDAQLHSKREVKHDRKHPQRSIPLIVLRRVSELAIRYPYPRERKSKLVRHVPVSAPSSSATCSDSSGSRSRGVVRQKCSA